MRKLTTFIDNQSVFVGLPSYSPNINFATSRAVLTHARRRGSPPYRMLTGSLLTWVFNRLWAEALNSGADYFAMLHGDIVPRDYWVDDLLEVLLERDADLVAAVAPIKNASGATSTAIDDPSNPWQPRRITMKELAKLPDVFDAGDVHALPGWERPGGCLLANTGCWICDLSKPWVRAQDEDSPFLRSTFVQLDGIFKDDAGQYQVATSPEDWNFSRGVNAAGGKVVCRQMPELLHFGDYGFPGRGNWGQDRDENYFATNAV